MLDRRPELYPDLQDICEAFAILNPSRHSGFGMGYIPLSEIKAYLELFGTDNVERFVGLLRHLDNAYVEAVRKRENKN